MNSLNITDYDIQALVDGELDEHDKSRLEDAMSRDFTLYSRYLVYQKQKELLKNWWKDH